MADGISLYGKVESGWRRFQPYASRPRLLEPTPSAARDFWQHPTSAHAAMTQHELPLFECAPDDPNVQQFVSLLLKAGEWLTAAEVLGRLRMLSTDSNRRMVRSWAEASDGEILSGQKGYRHIRHATPEEIQHAANWLLSQGKKMIKRGIKIRRNAHALVG